MEGLRSTAPDAPAPASSLQVQRALLEQTAALCRRLLRDMCLLLFAPKANFAQKHLWESRDAGRALPHRRGRSGREWGRGTAAAPGARVAARSGVPSRTRASHPSPRAAADAAVPGRHRRTRAALGTRGDLPRGNRPCVLGAEPRCRPRGWGESPPTSAGLLRRAPTARPGPARLGPAPHGTERTGSARAGRGAESPGTRRDATGRDPSGRVWGFPRSPSPRGLQLRQ